MGLDGIKKWFQSWLLGGNRFSTVKKTPSARAHGHVVVEYLAKKLKCGSIAGPPFQLHQFISYTLTDLVCSQTLNQVNGE